MFKQFKLIHYIRKFLDIFFDLPMEHLIHVFNSPKQILTSNVYNTFEKYQSRYQKKTHIQNPCVSSETTLTLRNSNLKTLVRVLLTEVNCGTYVNFTNIPKLHIFCTPVFTSFADLGWLLMHLCFL
jgi:hypothetical protein